MLNNYAADLMEHSREEMINRDFDRHMMEIFSLSLVQAFLSAIESALNDDMACQKLLVFGKKEREAFCWRANCQAATLERSYTRSCLVAFRRKDAMGVNGRNAFQK